jgi:Fe-Mn family superoxide dismutase
MFKLPDLPYEFNALEPFIDEETMSIHHGKHHATYVKNLNDALAGHDELLQKDINDLISDLDSVPEEVRTKVRNNGGGHSNHSLFWEIMGPQENKEVPQNLASAIDEAFESFENFKKTFTEKALGRFGSGWVFLVVKDSKLEILDTPNQDSPLMEGKGTPILGLDVWEHAYYLKYKNVRAEYIEAWWNVVNWVKVGELLKKEGENT